jgi:cobalt/nickel transport system permease protein
MLIEEFALGDSRIHRLDPRAKIVIAAVFSVVVALTHSLMVACWSLFLPIVLLYLARVPLLKVLGRLAVVNLFSVFLWILLPFCVHGQPLTSVGPFTVYREGVELALLITIKTNAIILAVMALLGTSPVFDLVHALSHLAVPDKLVHVFFFSYRYLHVLHGEYHRLSRAMRVRGFKPRTDLHTYRAYGYLVGMLLVRSFDRSQRIVSAMKCRGFKGRFYILHHYEMKQLDWCVTASGLLYSGILLVAR